ncbi:MAG: hypothetical protein KGJ13_04370 [Patescibacteria group bacterium]|nr:hypothetical protein [Patescibacteria group bacterium]
MKQYTKAENRTIATGVIVDRLKATGEFREVERTDGGKVIIKFQPSEESTKEFLRKVFGMEPSPTAQPK